MERPDRRRRPARGGRWIASGLTVAAAVGSVAAMADAADEAETANGVDAATGAALGATTAWQAEVVAAGLMAEADAGDVGDTDAPTPPPAIGRAGVS